MHECECAFVCEYRYPQSLEKVVGSPEAGETDSGEAPQVVARNHAQVFYRRNIHTLNL